MTGQVESHPRRTFLHVAGTGAAVMIAARSVLAADTSLKIATIGAGKIGSTLGAVWVKAGHEVMFSSRHPEEMKDLVASLGPKAHAGTVADAVKFGDVLLLAIPYSGMPDFAKEFGKAAASKAVVLDATNPYPERDGEVAKAARAAGASTYTMKLLPGVRIVRAFNAIPAARFGEGGMKDGVRMGIPIAGDDKKAIATAEALIKETGYEPVLVGSLAFGDHLIPGTPLAGEHSPEEIHKIAATLT